MNKITNVIVPHPTKKAIKTPRIEGFSKRNIFRMRAFYTAYTKVPQAVAQIVGQPIFNIPWGHNAILLEKVKNNDERFWYAQKTINEGWSRNALEASIKSNLYKREGKAITNCFTARSDKVPQVLLGIDNTIARKF